MARPVIPVITVFASDTLYTTGPVLLQGTATKLSRPAAQYDEGWVGDEVPPAQEVNDFFFQNSTWVAWVGEGSFAGAEDDHPVETDSDGNTALRQLNLLGHTTLAGPTLQVVSSNAGVAADIDSTNGSFALLVTSDAAGIAALRGLSTGTGPAVEGVALGTNNDGGEFSGTGTGHGVVGDGGSSGNGGLFTGGSAAGHGVVGIGDAGSSAGVRGEAEASAGSFAIEGIATQIDQSTIVGRTFAGATSSAIAIHGLAGNDATGVHGDAADGYGVVAESDTTTPARAALRLVPQDADPTTTLNGDVYFDSNNNRLHWRADGFWREVWSSVNGYTNGFGRDLTGGRNSGAFATQLSVTLAAPNEPSTTGTVVIRVSGRFRNQAAALSTIQIRVVDATAAANIDTDVEVRMSETNAAVTTSSANAYEKTISFTRQYPLPSAGVRTFDLDIATLVAGGVEWADLNMEIEGVY